MAPVYCCHQQLSIYIFRERNRQTVAEIAVENGEQNSATADNKAVIDRRLRPRCCHLGSYFL